MSTCRRTFPCPKCGARWDVAPGPARTTGRARVRRRVCPGCGHQGLTVEFAVLDERDVTLYEALTDDSIAAALATRLPSRRAARRLAVRLRPRRRTRVTVTRQQCAFGW